MAQNSKIYSGAQFVVSLPAFLKITAVILFVISSLVFLITPVCGGSASWPGKVYPIAGTLSGLLIMKLYLVFATGYAKRSYETWTVIDMAFNIIDFTAMLVVSIVTLSHCSGSGSSVHLVPVPMGIIGAVLLALSSAVWFAQTRYRTEDRPTNAPDFYRESETT